MELSLRKTSNKRGQAVGKTSLVLACQQVDRSSVVSYSQYMLEVEPKTVLISIGNCALQTETSQLRYDSTGNLNTRCFVSWLLCVSNPHRNSKSTLLRIYTTKTSIVYCIFSESIPDKQLFPNIQFHWYSINQPTSQPTILIYQSSWNSP